MMDFNVKRRKYNTMENKFQNIEDIDKLTEQECKEILKNVRNIVLDFPSFVSWGYESYRENYACCCGNTTKGHDRDCPIRLLKDIFD